MYLTFMNELHIMLGNGKGVNSWCNGVRFVLIHTFQMRSKLVDVLLLVVATSSVPNKEDL
jgi:hypothetical protein